ncbi:MAG: hypothetical protein JSR83_24555 [Proteobacteria bacterium]|nr:hypothetical protein [Pseudomonadota bacterium]
MTEYMALLSKAAQKQAEVESLVSTTPCTASSQCSTLVLRAQTRPCPFTQRYDYSLASTTAAAARAAADAYNKLSVQAAAIEPPNNLSGTCFEMVDFTPLSCVANKCVRQFVFDGPPAGPPPEGIWVSGTLQLFVSVADVVWAVDTAAATPTLYTGPLARQGTNLTATLSQIVGSSETKSSLVATISNTPTPSIRIERLDGITHLPMTLAPVTSYFSPSALSQIAGSYDLSSGERIVVDANGSVRSTEPGCTIQGSIEAPWTDRNVYYLGITFGPAPCKTPMAFIEGILAPRPDDQLFVAIRRVPPDVAALNMARVN